MERMEAVARSPTKTTLRALATGLGCRSGTIGWLSRAKLPN